MSLSYALRVIKLVPAAVRVSVAGGAAYGSIKVGMWSPRTEDSREKLDQLQREIHYPTSRKIHGETTLSVAVEGWNSFVKTTFLTLTGSSDGLQLETLNSLKVGLKRWGSEIKNTVVGSSNSDKKS